MAKGIVEKMYRKFKLRYDWFFETQWGDIENYGRSKWKVTDGFRWRGRKGYHTLTSGKNDYVDYKAWMIILEVRNHTKENFTWT